MRTYMNGYKVALLPKKKQLKTKYLQNMSCVLNINIFFKEMINHIFES